MKCFRCAGKMGKTAGREIFKTSGRECVLDCEFYECKECGERIFNERQAADIAKKLGEAGLKTKQNHELRLISGSGSLLICSHPA